MPIEPPLKLISATNVCHICLFICSWILLFRWSHLHNGSAWHMLWVGTGKDSGSRGDSFPLLANNTFEPYRSLKKIPYSRHTEDSLVAGGLWELFENAKFIIFDKFWLSGTTFPAFVSSVPRWNEEVQVNTSAIRCYETLIKERSSNMYSTQLRHVFEQLSSDNKFWFRRRLRVEKSLESAWDIMLLLFQQSWTSRNRSFAV